MTEKNQNAEKKQAALATAESADVSRSSLKEECCDQILDRLDKGLPVILTGQTADVTDQPGADELKFLAIL